MISKETRSQIIRFSHRMDSKGWVANHDGNITVKLPDGRLAATPTARFKGDLVEDYIIELDSSGKKVAGSGNPFSELSLHLKAYATRSDVQAVVHAHPPFATAAGCANQEMLTWAIPEAVVSLGSGIPLVALGLPNSPALMSEYESLLPYYDAVMVGGNGVFAWGTSLEQAFLRVELVEHLAKILVSAVKLGGPKLLSEADVASLLKKRADAGLARPKDPKRPHWFPGQLA